MIRSSSLERKPSQAIWLKQTLASPGKKLISNEVADRRSEGNSRMHYGGVETGEAVSASYNRESIARDRAATDYMKIRGEGRTRSDHILYRIKQPSGCYRAIGGRSPIVEASGGDEPSLRCLS